MAMINIKNMIDTQVRLCWRKDEIPHNDRSKKGLIIEFSFCQQYSTKFKLLFLKPLCEGVDARHILPQREERPLPQHPGQQRLHQVHLLNRSYVVYFGRQCLDIIFDFTPLILQDFSQW